MVLRCIALALQLAELAADEPSTTKLTAGTPASGVVVAILIVLGLAKPDLRPSGTDRLLRQQCGLRDTNLARVLPEAAFVVHHE